MKESAFGSAIRLIEDGLVLVKRADATTWLIYSSGVVPFFAVLLFEVTDLAQNPFAGERLGWIAFLLAASYLWLHVCQSVFCGRLQAMITGSSARTGSQFVQTLAVQTVLAPSKLILWPLALAVLVPHASVTMFYQHSLVPMETAGRGATIGSAIREAKLDAEYRRGQAVWVLLLVLMLRAILWINLLALLLFAPALLKTLTGFEGKLTRSPDLLLNPTALVALCALAYIGLDPVVKACCALRRFARQAETSGRDLHGRLSILARGAAAMVCAALCVGLPLRAAAAAEKAPAVSAAQMDRALESVFHDPRNSWDLPAVSPRKPASNAFVAFMDSISDRLNGVWKWVDSSIRDVVRALRRIFSNSGRRRQVKPQPVSNMAGWMVIGFFSVLLAAALAVAWRKRMDRSQRGVAETVVIEPKSIDVAHEETSALDQPVDEWLRLAEKYRSSGNLRFALRALYLATLAGLGRKGLISLARGKSNLDYFRELERRTRRDPEFLPAFRANVGLFEASWYGEHPVTEETLAQFEQNCLLLSVPA